MQSTTASPLETTVTNTDQSVQGIEYLRDVNPAGTVPVLIHNGHPVYESHEQIVYIDQVQIMLPLIFIDITNMAEVLMPGGPKLTPTDPEKKKVMEKWVNQGAMIMRSFTRTIIEAGVPIQTFQRCGQEEPLERS